MSAVGELSALSAVRGANASIRSVRHARGVIASRFGPRQACL